MNGINAREWMKESEEEQRVVGEAKECTRRDRSRKSSTNTRRVRKTGSRVS